MKTFKLSALVLDFDLYPRGSVDSHHAAEIAAAIEAGAVVPPIVIEKKSKRIVDGFHRWKALRKLHGEDYETECVEKTYQSDGELLLDAMRYNVNHGRALTQHDKTHCLLLAEKFDIDVSLVAETLHLTAARVSMLVPRRVANLGRQRIALKQTIRHMGGSQLTKAQSEVNEKLGGMNQLFYVNQLIMLIENDLVDIGNNDLLAGLAKLGKLLNQFGAKAA